MKFQLLAVLGLAAAAYAQDTQEDTIAIGDVAGGDVVADVSGGDAAVETYTGPVGFPPGIAAPDLAHLPKKGPPPGAKKPVPIWHPPHHGVDIDDCDDEEADDWHWADRKKGPKGPFPPHKWTSKKVTVTKTHTVEVTTTVYPVPVTEEPHPHPKPPHKPHEGATKDAPAAPPAKPTGAERPAPPKATADASAVPQPPVVVGGAAKNAVGVLGAVAALVAALI